MWLPPIQEGGGDFTNQKSGHNEVISKNKLPKKLYEMDWSLKSKKKKPHGVEELLVFLGL
jgi:hypothetical protein